MDRSPFAIAIDNVMASTGIARPSLAGMLGVELHTLEGWTLDESIPAPDVLMRLVMLLRDCRVPEENPESVLAARREFARVLAERSSRVTPFRMGGSPGFYMLTDLRGHMEGALSTVPLRVQEEILLRSIEACATMRHIPEGQYDALSPERPKIDL